MSEFFSEEAAIQSADVKIPEYQTSITEMPTALSESSIAGCWKMNGISRVCTGRRPPEHSISTLGSKVMIQMSQNLSGNCKEIHSYPSHRIPFGCCSNMPDLTQKRHPRTKIHGIHVAELTELNSVLFLKVLAESGPFHMLNTGEKLSHFSLLLSVSSMSKCIVRMVLMQQ